MSDSYNAQEPQEVVQQGQQLPGQALSNAPSVNAAGENLQCQWVNCAERCVSPEALYEHVCERHVGRKSTNNLNLTCQWGQCHTTTVKRDHITSHIRVHVPLKPHKCEFCGKAFKRPQDLKKHVKTHADDSVIMRSPGPNDGQRGPQQQGAMMYNGEKNPQYYAQALGPPQDYGQHANSQYYQQQTQGQHPGYGPVPPSHYYPGPQPQTYDYDQRRKHGFEALDQFLGEVKRQQIATNDYQSITNRLFALQGLQLPLIAQQPVTSIPAYQPVSALGGGYHDADPIQAYSLPPMGNAKTREDLTSIDQILEQMQATIYENETGAVNQQGSAYAGYHPVNSPNATLPSTHAQTAALARSHQNSLSGTEHASTPGLTPPSSAQSYTSGHSPMTGHAAPSSGAMYPNLPAGDMGYQTGNGATLGSHYDNEDPRRRFSGGMLQRAQPARDRRSEGSATPPAAEMNKKSATKGKKKGSPAQSAIDPALSGEGTPGSKGEMSKEEPEHNRNHDNMRLIEWMREFIHKQVQKLDTDGVDITTDGGDVEMGGTEENLKQDAAALYPLMNDLKGA